MSERAAERWRHWRGGKPVGGGAKAGQRREIELDFIRGIAILLVLTFHAHSKSIAPLLDWTGIPSFGWAGVDVFFVLSGFLVGGLLVKEWQLKGRIDSGRFLIRRALKIWPAYYFFLLLNLVSGHRTFRQLAANFLNVQNYFRSSTWIAHTWSLAVEEHFYLLLLLCMAVAAWRKASLRHLLVGMGVVGVGVTILRIVLYLQGFNVYYATHTRIDGLIWGVMLAILWHHWPNRFREIQRQTWLYLLILIGAAVDFYVGAHSQAGGTVCAWTNALKISFADWGGVALLMLLYRNHGKQRGTVYRFVAWIGLYSYGIYLWHVSVDTPLIHISHYLPRVIRPAFMYCGFISAGTLLGIAMTKLVEFPMLRVRDRVFPRPVDSAAGAPAIIESEVAAECGVPQ